MILRALMFAAAAGVAAYLVAQERRRPVVPESSPDDGAIAQRIRETLADVVADPGAIHVSVRGGAASLRGPVLPGERDRALAATLDVPGVIQVANLLEPVQPAATGPT